MSHSPGDVLLVPVVFSDGKIEAVNVKIGDTVESKDLLVLIKE